MLVLGIPTLNRYDLLYKLLDTIHAGSVNPDLTIIIDNGGRFDLSRKREDELVISPGSNIGVAKSWNKIIEVALSKDSDPDIVLSNDDLEVGFDLLEKMLAVEGEAVFCSSLGSYNGFSFFLLRTACINKVGLFDENFYPAYYEDNDYFKRMLLAGVIINDADAMAVHIGEGSQTLKKFTPEQMGEHHKNFKKNQEYYLRKWGGLPFKEVYNSPFNE